MGRSIVLGFERGYGKTGGFYDGRFSNISFINSSTEGDFRDDRRMFGFETNDGQACDGAKGNGLNGFNLFPVRSGYEWTSCWSCVAQDRAHIKL